MQRNRTSQRVGFGFAALLAVVFCAQAPFSALAADPTPQAANFVETKSAGSVDVTVYGNSFAQVEETRQVALQAGRNRIQLNGIAAQYRPDSLRVVGVSGPGKWTYKTATYQSANLTWEQILTDSVGEKITATIGSGANAKDVTGTLLSVNGGGIVLQGDDGKTYLTTGAGVSLSKLPAGLSNTAALVVECEVSVAGTYNVNFLYETGGVVWAAKHSVTYDDVKQKLESFETTVNVINQSGTSFDNATLWLLSGNVNEARTKGGFRTASADYNSEAAVVGSSAVQSVGERKVYKISEKISLANGQSRQIPLFSAVDVPVVREYYVSADSALAAEGLVPVGVRLKLKNCKESHLGTPLPGGTVKVYQRNSDKKLQLTDNANLKEVARDEAFTLVLGSSSDIKAENKLTKSVKVPGPASTNPNVPQTEWQDNTYEVKAHNFKEKTDVEVIVEVTLPADQQNVAPLTRESATLGTAKLNVTAGKNSTVTYTLRQRRY